MACNKRKCSQVFKELHESESFIKFSNSSLLVLIFKIEGMTNIKNFRPISLVGSVYRLIVKVLARRTAKVIVKIVGKCQHAFVEGRQILNATLVVS